MMMRGLGYLPDPAEISYSRFGTVHATALGASYPSANLSLVRHAPLPTYQDDLQGCVGWACAIAAYAKQSAEGYDPVFPSPGFIWWNSRKQHGDHTLNVGTYPHVAIASLNDIGMCAERYWTIEQTKWHFNKKPSRLAFTHAYDPRFEIKTQKLYGSGDSLKQQVKAAFAVQGPITFGLMLPASFLNIGPHDVIEEPPASEPIVGGHYMSGLGYDEQGIVGPQTWRDWGNRQPIGVDLPAALKGSWFRISWDYFLKRATDIVSFKFVPRIG